MIADYRVGRPAWGLAVLWYGALTHLALNLVHCHQWLWLPDIVPAAFLLWVARSAWIYLTPRADARPG